MLFAIAERGSLGGLALLMQMRAAYSEDVFGCHKVLSNGRCSATPRTDAGPAKVVFYADEAALHTSSLYDRYRVSRRFQVARFARHDEDCYMKFLEWIWSRLKKPIPQSERLQSQGISEIGDKIEKFIDERLGGQNVPNDLDALLRATANDPGFEKSVNNPLKEIGAEILWADGKYPLLDHDYLNEVDRADPDIMANVKAMQDTDKKLKFVVQCEDTSLIGYWQQDADTRLDQCALFWLDTEGQYYLTEGRTLSEAFTYRALVDDDKNTFRSLRAAFERLGVSIRETDESQIFADMDARAAELGETPENFRNERYEYYKSLS
ncbi:hypothetical protein [uncultured Litoreibacter sp.]|uniref:hypothetical protein n=1 Tax=uncultured Litoreibacter sp. TaxID=1392394 RepID=UPI0026034FEF|nr:hypothetical protein [uncultured Litoreibacter sp.]